MFVIVEAESASHQHMRDVVTRWTLDGWWLVDEADQVTSLLGKRLLEPR